MPKFRVQYRFSEGELRPSAVVGEVVEAVDRAEALQKVAEKMKQETFSFDVGAEASVLIHSSKVLFVIISSTLR